MGRCETFDIYLIAPVMTYKNHLRDDHIKIMKEKYLRLKKIKNLSFNNHMGSHKWKDK